MPDADPSAAHPLQDHLYAGVSLRAKLVALSGLLLAVLLAALDQTIIATAMPRVVADLGGFDRFSWVFTAFMLASTTCIPIAGKLSDLYGRKWIVMAATAIFITGSMLAGTSNSMTELIIFRGAQGIGAAGIFANAFASLADMFAPADRAKWQGLFGATFGISSVAGPLLGGFITDNWDWRWIFYINLPVGFLSLVVVFLGMPNLRHARQQRHIDFAGAGALAVAVVSLLLALTWAGDDYAWGSPQVLGLLAASVTSLGLFLWIERGSPEPIVPLGLFKNPVIGVSMAVLFLTGFAMFASIVYIPLFMQGVVGVSATNSGIVIMPMSVGMVLAAVAGSQIIARTGNYKYVTLGGLFLMAIGMLLLSRMDQSTTSVSATIYMVIVGVGVGVTFPTFFVAVQNSVGMRVVGVATALVQFFRSIGGTVGVAVLGAIMGASVNRVMTGALPGTLPADVRELLTDPQLLMDAGGRALVEARLAYVPGGDAAFQQALDTLRLALTQATQDIFFTGLVVSVAACILVLFLRQQSPEHADTQGVPEVASQAVAPRP